MPKDTHKEDARGITLSVFFLSSLYFNSQVLIQQMLPWMLTISNDKVVSGMEYRE